MALTLVAAACAPQGPALREQGQSAQPGQSTAPKRLLAAIRGDPHTVYQQLNPASNIPGIDTLQELVHAGLTVEDDQRQRRPQLAEATPSIENGLWRVLPDGRMETTWRLREGARWQDGAPITSDDLLFTAQVMQDRDLPIFADAAFDSIEDVEAPDPRTVTVKWKRPYIEADSMFDYRLALPIPRHLLERPYAEDKESFIQHPYWSTEFVGAGPFKLKEWVRGSHLVLEANPLYVLGRPKLDEVIVRFIPDPSTLAANVLAGTVEFPLGGRLSLEWGMTLRDQWPEGRLDVTYSNWIVIFPQFINPSPPVVADLRFRRALMHATDRQALVETLQFGLSSVAHSFLNPNQAEYREIESRLIRYEYDPRRASQLVEGLGHTRGSDGTFRDASGQRLAVELRTSLGDDLQEKAMFATADYWQRLGVQVEPHLVVPQRARDREYRTTFPGFDLKRNPNDVRGLRREHSSQTPLPENQYQASGNNSRYINPEFDSLIDRVFTTIPKAERTRYLGEAIYHISDRLNLMGLFYNTNPILVSKRILNVRPSTGSRSSESWNAHEWDFQ